MPIYKMKCKCCEYEFEVMCSYDKMKDLTCSMCNSSTYQIPSSCMGIVNGVCYKNGWDNEVISYDGRNVG